MHGGSEGQRENPKQAHTQREPDVGLDLTTVSEIMAWAKIKSQTLSQQSHPGTPHLYFLIVYMMNSLVVYPTGEHDWSKEKVELWCSYNIGLSQSHRKFGDRMALPYCPNVGQKVMYLQLHMSNIVYNMTPGKKEIFVEVAFFSQQQTPGILCVCVCVWHPVRVSCVMCHPSIFSRAGKNASIFKKKRLGIFLQKL